MKTTMTGFPTTMSKNVYLIAELCETGLNRVSTVPDTVKNNYGQIRNFELAAGSFLKKYIETDL